MTDLSDLTPKSDTIVITLTDPRPDNIGETLYNKDKTPMTVTLYAPHSKEYKRAVHKQTQKRLKKAQGKRNQEINFDDLDDITLEILADTTVEWNITWSGKQPEYSKELAKEVYEKAFWIKSQIDEGVQEASVFT